MEQISNWVTGNIALAFYLIVIVSIIITRLPFIGVFFRTVNTLLHESGHAIGAIVTSGEVVKIDLNKDTSGVAQTKSKGRAGAFITSFAGYPFAALASSVLLVMTITDYYRMAAFILLSFTLLNLMLFVRNIFGIIWLLLFSALIIAGVWYADDFILKMLLLFVSMIAFTETLASSLIITYLSFSKPRQAGDMANMQKTTGIPAVIWALINLMLVSGMMYYTIVHYFPAVNQLEGVLKIN